MVLPLSVARRRYQRLDALPARAWLNRDVRAQPREKVMSCFRLTVIALSLALYGCITPPKLEPQQQAISNNRLGLTSQVSGPAPVQAWWSTFDDPQFDALMQRALADNPTLAQAIARVREAESLADVTRAALAPSLSF